MRRMTALLLAATVAVLLHTGSANAQTPPPAAYTISLPLIISTSSAIQESQPRASLAQQVIDLVNQERAQAGCPALTVDPALVAAAEAHTQDMANNDFFSHTGSDGSKPWDRMERAGYMWTVAAENISAGRQSPEETVAGWMASEGHRANILDCSLRETGVGYVYLADDPGAVVYHAYWTQVFGSR